MLRHDTDMHRIMRIPAVSHWNVMETSKLSNCGTYRVQKDTLRWRHNDQAGVSNHQPQGCLLNRLFRRQSKKTSKLRVTGLCARNSPGTGEFPAQMASYAENVSIWWRHHVSNMPQEHTVHTIVSSSNQTTANEWYSDLMMTIRRIANTLHTRHWWKFTSYYTYHTLDKMYLASIYVFIAFEQLLQMMRIIRRNVLISEYDLRVLMDPSVRF